MTPLSKDVNRRIGQAMHRYEMLDDGDQVMIAVSGGIDSAVTAALYASFLPKKNMLLVGMPSRFKRGRLITLCSLVILFSFYLSFKVSSSYSIACFDCIGLYLKYNK